MPQAPKKGTPDEPRFEALVLKREQVVVMRPEARLQATREGVTSAAGVDVAPLSHLLASEGVRLQPLFGVSEERLHAEAASLTAKTGDEVPDLSVCCRA